MSQVYILSGKMGNITALELQDALAAELRAAQGAARVNVRVWATSAAVTHDTVYRVLSGRRPISVVELVRLCEVIDENPLDLISRAIERTRRAERASRAVAAKSATRARLALEAAGLYSDLDGAYVEARTALSRDALLLSKQEWREFLAGTASPEIVAALSSFLEVPSRYLAGIDDPSDVHVESQLKFTRRMRELGVTRLAARSLGELQPDEIHAVETAVREFIEEEADR